MAGSDMGRGKYYAIIKEWEWKRALARLNNA
jgi:hypothetical protein